MKTILLVLAAGFALSGCVVAPAYDVPGPYYAPAPAVVVQPYFYGYGGRWYGHGGRHWR